jgi:EAL domain-containing protein (putative c-di-GMP-specific phosphodiesterase class I)
MLWQAIGVNIVLADFGTGFSSLRYLRSFQFDQIRIDRSFVQANIDRSFVKDSGLQTSAPRGLVVASRPSDEVLAGQLD